MLSLLYTGPGSDPGAAPILLMAHQDVVPVAAGSERISIANHAGLIGFYQSLLRQAAGPQNTSDDIPENTKENIR